MGHVWFAVILCFQILILKLILTSEEEEGRRVTSPSSAPASRSEEDLGWEVLLGRGLLCRLVLSQGCDSTCFYGSVSIYKVVQKDFTI